MSYPPRKAAAPSDRSFSDSFEWLEDEPDQRRPASSSSAPNPANTSVTSGGNSGPLNVSKPSPSSTTLPPVPRHADNLPIQPAVGATLQTGIDDRHKKSYTLGNRLKHKALQCEEPPVTPGFYDATGKYFIVRPGLPPVTPVPTFPPLSPAELPLDSSSLTPDDSPNVPPTPGIKYPVIYPFSGTPSLEPPTIRLQRQPYPPSPWRHSESPEPALQPQPSSSQREANTLDQHVAPSFSQPNVRGSSPEFTYPPNIKHTQRPLSMSDSLVDIPVPPNLAPHRNSWINIRGEVEDKFAAPQDPRHSECHDFQKRIFHCAASLIQGLEEVLSDQIEVYCEYRTNTGSDTVRQMAARYNELEQRNAVLEEENTRLRQMLLEHTRQDASNKLQARVRGSINDLRRGVLVGLNDFGRKFRPTGGQDSQVDRNISAQRAETQSPDSQRSLSEVVLLDQPSEPRSISSSPAFGSAVYDRSTLNKWRGQNA